MSGLQDSDRLVVSSAGGSHTYLIFEEISDVGRDSDVWNQAGKLIPSMLISAHLFLLPLG